MDWFGKRSTTSPKKEAMQVPMVKKIKVDHTYLFVKKSKNVIICLKIL